MKKSLFLLGVILLFQGCVSFHNEPTMVPVLRPAPKDGIMKKKLLIINHFENTDPGKYDAVPEPDIIFFKSMTYKFYSDLNIFEITKDAQGNADYSSYDYVIINRLIFSRNLTHGCLKMISVFGFNWLDKRTFYLNSVFKEVKNNNEKNYTAKVSYHKITSYLFPWFKIWGKTEFNAKKELFGNLNTMIFHGITGDYFGRSQ